MKLAGFLLLLSGWIVVLAAIVLLLGGARVGFVLAGVATEGLGLGLAIHAHCSPRSQRG